MITFSTAFYILMEKKVSTYQNRFAGSLAGGVQYDVIFKSWLISKNQLEDSHSHLPRLLLVQTWICFAFATRANMSKSNLLVLSFQLICSIYLNKLYSMYCKLFLQLRTYIICNNIVIRYLCSIYIYIYLLLFKAIKIIMHMLSPGSQTIIKLH